MSELITSRRRFLTGLGAALIVAPAIVRAGSLMPVRRILLPADYDWRMPPGAYLASPQDVMRVVMKVERHNYVDSPFFSEMEKVRQLAGV